MFLLERMVEQTGLNTRIATLAGFAAILMWSTLAVLIVATGAVPPFQLTAMTFAIGAIGGAVILTWRRDWGFVTRMPPASWLHGVCGLFLYHALYFFALRFAPPAQAGLVNYLWPLLIVLLSGFLPGERLRPLHLIGALLGFCGTIILFAGRENLGLAAQFWPGYAAAFAAAFIWAGYSVLSRVMMAAPASAVVPFSAITALLAALCHLAFETTFWPASLGAWLAMLALGIGPVGIAFQLWQIGMKHGNMRLLGIMAYAAPLLSTGLLIAFGLADFSMMLIASAILIVSGGLIAVRA